MKSTRSPLSHDQAEVIGADVAARWNRFTGQSEVPGDLALADLVQFILRRAAEMISAEQCEETPDA